MLHFAEAGQPDTLCSIPIATLIPPDLPQPDFTTDPEQPIDCPACLIRALRGEDAPPMTAKPTPCGHCDDEAVADAALRYCFTCMGWYDDTECYPGDHSRHCGHELKVLGQEVAREYRLICHHKVTPRGKELIPGPLIPGAAA